MASDWARPRANEASSSSSGSNRNWRHSDEDIRRGITYTFRYMGSVEILESMKSMQFHDRSQVAKESITRVCESHGILSPSRKKRHVDKHISQVLGRLDLTTKGVDVMFVVDTERIQILNLHTKDVLVSHDLPDISFASAGDSDTIDFLAYVGKSSDKSTSLPGRWCYVLECGADLTQECVSTIGHAFDCRFRQVLRATQSATPSSSHIPPSLTSSPRPSPAMSNRYSGLPGNKFSTHAQKDTLSMHLLNTRQHQTGHNESDYYNDMPGKVPPQQELIAASQDQQVPDPNLICLESPSYEKAKNAGESMFPLDVTDSIPHSSAATIKDPFDVARIEHLLGRHPQFPQLESFVWFHGKINRIEAESVLNREGDFLIREGKGAVEGIPGPKQQFVLSAVANNEVFHILLVDYDGVIRTRDRDFSSLPQFVDLHVSSRKPIDYQGQDIYLTNSVPCRR